MRATESDTEPLAPMFALLAGLTAVAAGIVLVEGFRIRRPTRVAADALASPRSGKDVGPGA